MADEIVCKRGEDRAPGAAGREHDEILERMPPPFKSLVEFMRKTNQAVGETINQPQEQEVRTI